eukprot:scaffold2224_cov261-Pinguiococcus_pyrenoidosus.AAC.7
MPWSGRPKCPRLLVHSAVPCWSLNTPSRQRGKPLQEETLDPTHDEEPHSAHFPRQRGCDGLGNRHSAREVATGAAGGGIGRRG